MIFLAITPIGVHGALKNAADSGATVWCGADAMSEQEFDAHLGSNVSRFNYSLGDASEADIAGAVETIREHHPSAIIWIESQHLSFDGSLRPEAAHQTELPQ